LEVSDAGTGLSDRQKEVFGAIKEAVSTYYNYTGQIKCNNISDQEGTGKLDGYGWNVLACNELIMPLASNGETDMYLRREFDYEGYAGKV